MRCRTKQHDWHYFVIYEVILNLTSLFTFIWVAYDRQVAYRSVLPVLYLQANKEHQMKKIVMGVAVAIMAVSIGLSSAEAKRMGGGGSFGKQSQSVNRSAPAQSAQSPGAMQSANSARPGASPAAAAPKPAPVLAARPAPTAARAAPVAPANPGETQRNDDYYVTKAMIFSALPRVRT